MNMFSKIALIMLLLTLDCLGGVIATVPLTVMLSQADSVLVATVIRSESTNDTLFLDLTVLRTIKGTEESGHTVQATWSFETSSSRERAKHLLSKTGIWFLKQSGSTWKLLPLVMGDTQVADLYILTTSDSLPATNEYSFDAQPQNRLVKEIEAAAMNPVTAKSTIVTLRALDDKLGPALVQDLFSKSSSSSNLRMKLAGVSGQFRNGAPHAATALLSLAPDTLPADTQNQLSRDVCGYRSTDKGEIESLSTLLGAQFSDGMRFCAAHAFLEIHTAQTLPLLESLFSDPIARIRYDAVVGVAQYAMGFPIARAEDKHVLLSSFRPGPKVTNEMRQHFPTEPKFEINEQDYISYWREWLKNQAVQ